MEKDYLDRERLVADFFAGYEADPLIIDPEEFFLVEKNGIMDAEIVSGLQKAMESVLGKGCFVIINDESINACAMEKDGVPIIALYAGTIKKIFCDAGIMMLSDEFLTGVGELGACYHDIRADDHGLRVDKENDFVLKMDISGDHIRETVGYMIASLALHFIIYHEMGHHKLGHIRKLKEKYNLFYQEALSAEISEEYAEERKQMELDADLYAADMLVEKMDSLMESWGELLDIDFGYSEIFQLLIPALVLIKENLPMGAYSVEEIESNFYLPNIIRIAITAMVVARKPHIKEVLWNDILAVFLEDEEYRKQFEAENDMVVLDDSNQLTETAFERFYALMIAGTEQVYTKIFVGNYFPALFQTDIKAMNWFLHLYK